MINRITILCTVLMLSMSTAIADVKKLSLSEVLHSAQAHYPLVLAAEKSITIAKAQLLKASGSFDPNLLSGINTEPNGGYENYSNNAELSIPIVYGGARVFVGYRRGRGDWPIYYQNNLTNSGGEFSYGIELPLLRDFMIDPQRANVMEGKTNIALQRQLVNEVLIDILTRAGIAYWEWVKCARMLQYSQELLKLANIREKALLRRHLLGDVAKVELVENDQFIYQRKAGLVFAQQNYLRASIVLSLYYRDSHGHPIIPRLSQVPQDHPLISMHASNITSWLRQSKKIIAANPLIKMFDRKIKIQEIKLRLVKNQLMPHLNLRVASQKQYGSGGDPRLLPTANTIALNFSIPVSRREARGQYQAIQAQIHQLTWQKNFQIQRLYAQFKTDLNELENDRKQYFYLRKEVDAAKLVEHAEMVRFREGDSSLFLVNQREQTTFSARLRELEAEITFYQTKINLQRVCAFSCKGIFTWFLSK